MNNMKYIFAHIRESVISIICVLLMILMADMVLLTSSELKRGLGDIFYLNVLFAAIALISGWASHLRFRARYLKLAKALDNREYTDYVLPAVNSFISSVISNIAEAKNEECRRKTEVLQNSLDELNDYITKWVHEIKMPVAVCELIAEDAGATGSKTSGNMKIELERMRFLINQVLYAAKASRYEKDLTISEFSLAKTVSSAVKRNSAFFIRKNIEVAMEPPCFNIINDEKWVSYILDQILNNAGKYVRHDGRLEIHAVEDEKAVRLHIRDNGIGIAEHDLGRIFDKGFTGKNVRMMTKSTGMGLYYAKTMADKLGIGLEAVSRIGEYTEFILIFYKINDMLKL